MARLVLVQEIIDFRIPRVYKLVHMVQMLLVHPTHCNKGQPLFGLLRWVEVAAARGAPAGVVR